jgi:hypothetical protein
MSVGPDYSEEYARAAERLREAEAKLEACRKKWERRDRLFIRPLWWFSIGCLVIPWTLKALQWSGVLR